jgi:hypothetical protein
MKFSVSHVSLDESSDNFMVSGKVDEKYFLYLFDPSSIIPLFSMDFSRPCRGLQFFNNMSREFLYLDSNWELFYFVQNEKEEETVVAEDKKVGFFEKVYGNDVFTKDHVKKNLVQSVELVPLEFLETDSHLLARPGKLVKSFLENMLKPKSVKMDVPIDVDMESAEILEESFDFDESESDLSSDEESVFGDTVNSLNDFGFLDSLMKEMVLLPSIKWTPKKVETPMKVQRRPSIDASSKSQRRPSVDASLKSQRRPSVDASVKTQKRSSIVETAAKVLVSKTPVKQIPKKEKKEVKKDLTPKVDQAKQKGKGKKRALDE